jgi:tRNA (cmo5U34)-methyltransferase
MTKDNIYSDYQQEISKFVFDGKVVSVFDDMIRRSVPGYSTVIGMTKAFTEQYAANNSNLYDLGCSLGAATLAMRKGLKAKNCRIIAIDNSQSMIDRCKEIIESDISPTPVDIINADIIDTQITNASIVCMNFTMQFLPPDKRAFMLKKIYDGLLDTGLLILSEKICFDTDDQQCFQTDMYHNFKKLNGYSDLEVSQKRKALENVLIPDTITRHKERLTECGFKTTYLWFQCFNFISLAAFK